MPGAAVGALGSEAARFRTLSDLPSVVLRTLPALRFGKVVASVPHLAYVVNKDDVDMSALFTSGMTGQVFVPGH